MNPNARITLAFFRWIRLWFFGQLGTVPYGDNPDRFLLYFVEAIPLWALRGLATVHSATIAVFRASSKSSKACQGGYIAVPTNDDQLLQTFQGHAAEQSFATGSLGLTPVRYFTAKCTP